MGKGKVEFIARYTDEDCTVVERKVDTETAIASNDFDFSSIDAYLDCVDEYEKKLLAARNKIGDELFQAMLDSVEAKKGSKAPTSPAEWRHFTEKDMGSESVPQGGQKAS